MNDASRTVMRQRVLIAVALGILAIYAIFSIRDASSADKRLRLAHEDLNEVRQKLQEIDQLSTAPSIAALNTETPGAINERIDLARSKAQLPETAVIRQEKAGDPQRIDKTDYSQRKVPITLQALPLAKIVRFCEALRDEDTGSVVSDLKLTVPRTSGGGAKQEFWDATLILTQTIYSPKSQ